MLSDHSKHDFMPRHLDAETVADPYSQLHRFFDHAHLPHVRESLKEWVRVTVTGAYAKGLRRSERNNLVHFISHVERLIEAAHIIYERKYGAVWSRSEVHRNLSGSVFQNEHLLEKQGLYAAAQNVLSVTHADKIFFVDESAGTDGIKYHLLVFVAESTRISYDKLEDKILSQSDGECSLTLSLINSRRGYEQLFEGHLFYTLHCRRDRILYDSGDVPLPNFESFTPEQIRKAAFSALEKEYQKSKAFSDGAVFYAEKKQNALCCFMLQQSLELLLRGIIIVFKGEDVQTHVLEKLFFEVAKCIDISFLTGALNERSIRLLQDAYIKGRYSSNFQPTNKELRKLTDLIGNAQPALIQAAKNKII